VHKSENDLPRSGKMILAVCFSARIESRQTIASRQRRLISSIMPSSIVADATWQGRRLMVPALKRRAKLILPLRGNL
jgi:hypothetical protein